MRDVFIEVMVARKKTVQTTGLKALAAIGGLLIAFLLLTFSGFLGPFSIITPLLSVGTLYGAYYLITSMNVEFEYALTNGELDIDKIIAQRKRVRLATIDCKSVEGFGPYHAQEHQQKQYQTKLFVCDSPGSSDLFYIVSRQKEKGLTLVVFNGQERILAGMKPFLPRALQKNVVQGAKE